MNLVSTVTLSVPALAYLADIALASILVCGAALLIVRGWSGMALPQKHATLVGGLVVSLACPVVIGFLGGIGPSLIRIQLNRATDSTHTESNWPPQPSRQIEIAPTAGEIPATLDRPPVLRDGPPPTMAAAESARVSPTPPGRNSRSWGDLLEVVGTILTAAWAAGCLECLWQFGRGVRHLRRLLRSLSPIDDARLSEQAAHTARELGLSRVPQLTRSELICSPISVGVLHCRIVFPAGIAAFNSNQLQGLLSHELAHVARGDHIVGLLQRLATTVYWWNPLVRQASARVSALREQICDDLATGQASADGYAEMLVELASRAVNLRPLPTAIGIFDGPHHEFSERIRRLLDPRRAIVTTLDGRARAATAGMWVLLACLAATTPIQIQSASAAAPTAEDSGSQPEEQPSPAKDQPAVQDKADNENDAPAAAPIKWPSVLRGTIKDADGKPIAGARVRFDFETIHEYNIGRWDELLDSQSLVTGENGEYRFDASKLPNLTHRPFDLVLTCTAKGYADTKWWNWYTRDDVSVGEKLTDVTMLPGRMIRGRCVDRDGNPVPGAIVKMASDIDFKNQGPSSWAWDPRETNEDGEFEFSIPRDTDKAFEVLAIHSRWAPQRAAVPKSGDVLADIRLQNGAPLRGIVLRADGSPAAGAVVVADSVDDGTLRSVTFAAQVATRTDAKGNYNLQPLAGLYKVFLSQAERTDNRLEHPFVVADEPPPLVVPVRVALSGHETPTLDFHAGPTLKVRGTVRWADGRPVALCEVKASYMPPGNGTGIWLARTVTHEDGSYSIELPNPIDNVSIDVVGHYDDHRVWHSAFPDDKVLAKQKYQQNIQLNPLNGDLDGVDWVLRLPEPAIEPKAEVKDAAEIELERLGRRYTALEQKCRDAMDSSATPAEQFEAFKTLDPRIQLADDYLALEEKYRGTNVGLSALVRLDQCAASVSDAVPKVPDARRELVDRLLKYYLTDPNLDLALHSFNAGPQMERATELLRRAAAESPHRHVQAAALYYLALYLRELADAATQIDDVLAELEHAPQPNQAWIDMLKKQAASLKGIDPAAERTEAVELCQRTIRDYVGVSEPNRVCDQDGLIRERQPDPYHPAASLDFKTRAEGLLFDLEHLQVGMQAPPITGIEQAGRRVHFEVNDGKLTIVAFLSYGQEAIEAQLSELAAAHAEGSVAVVTIWNDMGIKPAGAPNESPPRIIENNNGPIMTQWAVDRWPCIFVIDQQGIIRGRRMGTAPADLVNRLLAKTAETDK